LGQIYFIRQARVIVPSFIKECDGVDLVGKPGQTYFVLVFCLVLSLSKMVFSNPLGLLFFDVISPFRKISIKQAKTGTDLFYRLIRGYSENQNRSISALTRHESSKQET
jgi:hypothetical protein